MDRGVGTTRGRPSLPHVDQHGSCGRANRSAALEEQLRSISTAAAELQAALTAAQDQVATDATTAETLRADLAAAKKKLTTLEASLRAAARVKAAPTSTGSKTTPARTAEPNDD